MEAFEALRRDVRRLIWLVTVIGTLLVALLAFLALLKDRDLDQRVRDLEEFWRLQLQWNEEQIRTFKGEK